MGEDQFVDFFLHLGCQIPLFAQRANASNRYRRWRRDIRCLQLYYKGAPFCTPKRVLGPLPVGLGLNFAIFFRKIRGYFRIFFLKRNKRNFVPFGRN